MKQKTTVGSINLSPPETLLDAMHLDELITVWLNWLYARRDKNTVDGYAYKMSHFRRWLADVGPKRSWLLRRDDFEEFARYLEQETLGRQSKPLSWHTQNDILRRLRQLFRWAYMKGYTEGRNYTSWVPSPDGESPRRKVAPLEALHRLFVAAGKSGQPGRDRAIIALFIGTGIRRSECASLRVEGIQIYADNTGVAVVIGKRTQANKSGRREVAFDAATGGFIRAYLDVYGLDSGPLFRAPNGAGLTPQGVYKAVKRAVITAGLEEHIVACHDLRRAFATHFARKYRGEVYADLLRRQLGHSSFRTTSQYLLLEADDMRTEIKSPVAYLLRPGDAGT